MPAPRPATTATPEAGAPRAPAAITPAATTRQPTLVDLLAEAMKDRAFELLARAGLSEAEAARVLLAACSLQWTAAAATAVETGGFGIGDVMPLATSQGINAIAAATAARVRQ